MAALQRFITYIYRYEYNEKKENAGFAKVEIRGSICRIEVHIRNIHMETSESTVYLFARTAEIMQGIPVGSIAVRGGNGDVRYAFETKELHSFGKSMQEIEGIFIPIGENDYLASNWKEGKLQKELFRIIEKQEGQADTAQAEEFQAEEFQEEEFQEEEDVSNVQATELPLEEFIEDKNMEHIFQKLRLKLELFFPFEGQEIECIRVQLKDLRELPKKYWYLGNNSFLLHGFFNYRHIILGQMIESGKKEYFIGVPGVFLNQERMMAAMFGFPEFRTAKTTEYKTGNFGYWYRII